MVYHGVSYADYYEKENSSREYAILFEKEQEQYTAELMVHRSTSSTPNTPCAIEGVCNSI